MKSDAKLLQSNCSLSNAVSELNFFFNRENNLLFHNELASSMLQK